MDRYHSIEQKLGRLLPPAISTAGMEVLEREIDELAGNNIRHEELVSRPMWMSQLLKWAALLTIVAVPVVIFIAGGGGAPNVLKMGKSVEDVFSAQKMVLLKSTKRIDGREDDGLIIPDDGGFPHYRYRYHITDEEQVRDTESGIVIILRQPSQEVHTVPVTQF